MSTPGGIDGGEIRLPIVADATGLARDVKAKVDAALARVRGQVQVTADTARADAQIRELQRAANTRASIQVDADTARAQAKIDALTRARGGLSVSVDADTDAAQRKIDALIARYSASKITITVDADTTRADASLRRVQSTQNALNGSKATVGVATTGVEQAVGILGQLGSTLVSVGKGVGIASGVLELAGAVTQLGGAAVALTSAIGPAFNLIGLLPAAGAAAAQGLLAVVAGFAGIGDAVKQTQQVQAQAAQQSATNAKAQEAAAQRVQNAVQSVADAQRQQARAAQQAAQQVQDAQDRVTRAVEDGARRVADARQRLADAGGAGARGGAPRQAGDDAAVVREAQSVTDARIRLARAEQDAQQRVADAEQRVAKVRQDSADRLTAAQQRVTDVQEQSAQRVIDAQDRIRKAQQAAADSAARDARAVTDAEQNIADVATRSAGQIQAARDAEASAERNLAQRQQDSLDAQQRLTQAREDAKRRLDELALSLKGASLDEEDAALAVIRAQQRLDKVNRSQAAKPIDRQEADLAYRQAVQRLDEVRQRNKELKQDASAAQQAGVEGAAGVVAARADVQRTGQAAVDAQQAVVDAQQAVVQAQTQAARDMADAQQRYSDALAKAAQDARQAQGEITAAQNNYTRVQAQNARDLADAQRALARTRQQNARDLADASQALARAEEQNTRDLSDARTAVARAQAQQAQDIAGAQQALAQAQRESARSVGDAQQSLTRARASAGQSTADAARTVVRAEQDLAAARRNATDTVDKESAAQRNLNQTYKALSPAARSFVDFLVRRFLPAVRDIRKQAQEGLLPGVQKALETLLPYAGAIGARLKSTARVFGDLAAAGARLITSGPFRRDFSQIADTNIAILRSLSEVVLNLVDVFRNVAAAGAPFLKILAGRLADVTERLENLVQRRRDSGQLTRMFDDAITTAGKLWHILKTLGDALFHLGHAARPAGDSLLQSLSDMIDKFDAWTRSPQGQAAITDFFNTAADGIRAFAGPLADIGRILSRTNSMQGLADALGFVADALERISALPGFGAAVDWMFKAAGLAIGIGLLLKVFRPLLTVLTGIKRLGRLVIPGAGRGGGTTTPAPAGTAPGAADRVQRVTWGPTALPVRIVGAVGAPVGGDPFDPHDPANRAPVDPNAPLRGSGLPPTGTPAPVGPMPATRRQRAAAALGRGTGRLAGAGILGFAGMVGGDMAANAIAGDSQRGSGRSILGNALGSGVQGAALGATVGSIIPGIGTAIGAAVGGAVGAIYGAIKGGLSARKVGELLAGANAGIERAWFATGRGIATAWNNTVGKLIGKVVGWWHDIVDGAQWLADRLVGHSIIPDMVKRITTVFGWLTAPIRTFIRWFTRDIPDAANAALRWVTGHWGQIFGILSAPLRLASAFYTAEWKIIRGGFSAVLSWVTAPASWNWGRILGTITAPIKAVIAFLTGRGTGWAAIRRTFSDVLTWVTSPSTWNWATRVLDVVTRPIKAVYNFLTGHGSGWAQIRRTFSDVLTWVTSPGTWNWAARVLSVVTSPIRSAYSFLTGHGSGWALIRQSFSAVRDWVVDWGRREWSGLKRIITSPVDAARAALIGRSGILTRIQNAFGDFVSGAGRKLSGLRSAWASPIHFVLDTVINRGLIGAFNRLAALLPGLGPIHTINIPGVLSPRSRTNPGGYATGTSGVVLPGYSPGRDVHRFYSATGGVLDLSGGEPVMRPEFGRAVGADWIDGANAAARAGGVPGVRRYLGGYLGGGILGKVGGVIRGAAGVARSVGSTIKRGILGATDALGDVAGAVKGAVSGAAGAITGAAGAVTGVLTDPVGWITGRVNSALGALHNLTDTTLGQAVAALPRAAANAIISQVEGLVGGLFGGGGGSPLIWPVGHVPLGPGFNAAGSHWGHTGGHHTGQDFTVPTGTPVHPALAGVVQVIRALGNRSYGNYIELSHGANLHTLYAHLSRFLVAVGDRVTPNEAIGLSGSTGNATGPHLHFEVRTGGGTGHPVDPMPYLRGQAGPGAGTGSGATGSGTQRWAGTVSQVLAMLGQPQTMAGAVLRRIQFESGGNPTAVNRSDSNWRAGHPSVGLMQVIGGTFNAYADRFKGIGPFAYGVSENPMANIYAGANYAVHRYGSLTAIDPQNRPRGYDSGGIIPPGYSGVYNGTGGNETAAVFTREQWSTLQSLVTHAPAVQHRQRSVTPEQMLAAFRSAPVRVDVHPAPGMDEVALAKRTAFEIEWARV